MGKHHRKSGFMGNIRGIGAFPILILVIITIFAFIALYGAEFGFTADMGQSLFQALPSTFLLVVSFWMLITRPNPLFIVGGFVIMGIGLAYLVSTLITLDILSLSIIQPWTLNQVMMFSVIVCTLFGGLAAAAVRRR